MSIVRPVGGVKSFGTTATGAPPPCSSSSADRTEAADADGATAARSDHDRARPSLIGQLMEHPGRRAAGDRHRLDRPARERRELLPAALDLRAQRARARSEDSDEEEVTRRHVRKPARERERVARLGGRVQVEAGDDRVGHASNLRPEGARDIGDHHGSGTARATDGSRTRSGDSVGLMTQSLQPYRGSYLMPAFEKATVADVMRPGVMSCAPDAPLVTVAQTMATHHVHSVVVAGITTDDAGGDHFVWGLVSDMDIVRAAETGHRRPHRGRRRAHRGRHASSRPTSLAEAAMLMDKHDTAHLIVTSGGRPTGVISSLDIAGALAWGRA